MKQTNYKKSIHSLKGLFLTGLILLSSSLFGQTVYDANFKPLNFGVTTSGSTQTSPMLLSGTSNTNVSLVAYNSSTTSSNNATSTGSRVIYKNVININGKDIDCIVTNQGNLASTASPKANLTTVFDRPGETSIPSGSNADNIISIDKMFNPVYATSSNSFNTFKFDFVLSSYSNSGATLSSFSPVTLLNFAMNIYDIDRDGGNGNVTNQIRINNNDYISFEQESGVYSTSTNNNILTIDAKNGNDQPTTNTSSLSGVIAGRYRARFVFSGVSSFSIDLGQDGSSSESTVYLGFSVGENWTGTTTDNTSSIILDLNGSTNFGFGNALTYQNCNTLTSFTSTSIANLSTTNTSNSNNPFITNLSIFYNTAEIAKPNSEFLVIGTGNNNSINLSSNTGSGTLTVPVSNQNQSYSYTISNNGSGRNTITFTQSSNNVNTMTLANAEALLDAIQFRITDCTTPAGSRSFGINTTLDLNTDILSPNAFITVNIPTALPVNIISFTGKATASGNQLNWTVAQEENFSHYEVLSSINGSTYNKVGEVYPENKSMDMKNYAFTDLSATADLVFYKLNLINEDGSSDFSNIVAINRNSVAPVITNVYPNPATTSLLVSLEGVDAEVSTITIQDLSGKIVYSTETSDVSTLLNINELNKGLYLIKVSNSNGIVSVSRFAKN